MAPSVVVIIREDPLKSHRPVEALRIALGLTTGPNPMTIVLRDAAARLLSVDIDDVVDTDILEKHRPVFKELGTTFVVPNGAASRYGIDPEFSIREVAESEIPALAAAADRVLTF